MTILFNLSMLRDVGYDLGLCVTNASAGHAMSCVELREAAGSCMKLRGCVELRGVAWSCVELREVAWSCCVGSWSAWCLKRNAHPTQKREEKPHHTFLLLLPLFLFFSFDFVQSSASIRGKGTLIFSLLFCFFPFFLVVEMKDYILLFIQQTKILLWKNLLLVVSCTFSLFLTFSTFFHLFLVFSYPLLLCIHVIFILMLILYKVPSVLIPSLSILPTLPIPSYSPRYMLSIIVTNIALSYFYKLLFIFPFLSKLDLKQEKKLEIEHLAPAPSLPLYNCLLLDFPLHHTNQDWWSFHASNS